MFEHKDIVEYIMGNSDAAIVAERLQDKLKDERRKREEFYELVDEDTKAEFINGEIVYHSPVMKRHNDATKRTLKLMDTFVEEKDLGYVGVEKILTTFTRNNYEPDVCFFNSKKASAFFDEQMKFPVPDLAVEVLSSSESSLIRDRETKFKDYEKHGVSEYWMIDPKSETIEQHLLVNGKYELVLKSSEGHITSHAIEGFTIPIRAIFDKKAHGQALRDLLKV